MSRVERHAAEENARAEKSNKGNQKRRKKGRITPFGRFLNIFGTLIMLVSILLCLGLAVPRYAGIQSYVVVSGSMEPEIPVGSMVYSKETTPATLEKGDVIVFFGTNEIPGGGDSNDVIPITHRVVENDKDKCEITTKGDANEHEDLRPVAYDNVVGIVIASIPHLGYIASPLATLMGKVSMALIIIAGYLLTEVGHRLRSSN